MCRWDLNYTPGIPTEKYLVGTRKSRRRIAQSARKDVDIVVEGDRIKSVTAHSAGRPPTGAKVIDASRFTVMPGLIESHSHLQAALGRSITARGCRGASRRCGVPGGTPYEAVSDREMADAAVRPGPRVFLNRLSDGV